MAPLDPAWIALIGTVFGGVGLKVLEHWLGKSKVKTDEATKIREELRDEILSQRAEIRQLELDVEKWRESFWSLREEFADAKMQYTIQLETMKRQLEEAQKAIDKLPKT